MNAASRSIRAILSGVVTAGLLGSGISSPVLALNCQQHGQQAAVNTHCCCGDNCRCGPSCSESSETSNKPQSTSVERDLRDLGKINSYVVGMAAAFVSFGRPVDLDPSQLASADCQQTLFAKHTCLRL